MGRLDHPLPLSFWLFPTPVDTARTEANAGAYLGIASALRSRARAARSQISNPAYHVSCSQAFSLKVLDAWEWLT